jgi:hypothetical protein
MVLGRGIFVLIAIAAMTGTAAADCRIIGGRFSLAQNHAVATTGVSTRGAPCGMNFASPANGHFDSIAVVARPSHGALRDTGAMTYLYKPTAGFKGVDTYALRLCGRDAAGTGCATITYNITVE